MNKLAQYIDHYRNQGAQAALQNFNSGRAKQASALGAVGRGLGRALPKSRMGQLGLGVGAGVAGLAGLGALGAGQSDPGMLEAALSGGKDMLSDLSPEDLAMYGSLLTNLGEGGGGYSHYDAHQPSPSDYALEDIGYADPSYASGYDAGYGGGYDPNTMGYDLPMSPEEESVYYDAYNQYR